MSSTTESSVARPQAPEPPPYQLEDIQGNILNAFGRQYATLLFFRFADDFAEVRQSLKRMLPGLVTSAARHRELYEAQKASETKKMHETLCMFGLSGSGYRNLRLARFLPVEPNGDLTPFEEGLKGWQDYAWDRNQPAWESNYSREPIDCFLFIANDDPARLAASVKDAIYSLRDCCTVVAEEHGHGLRDKAKTEYEHFGFPEANPKLVDSASVLIKEGMEYSMGPGYGCFASYLKIEQNVSRFHAKSLDCESHLSGAATAHQVREHSVGRDYTGALLLPPGTPPDSTFTGVPESVCPMHAHVRAMRHHNTEKPRPMVRRSVSYGAERPDIGNPDTTDNLPETGSGLLFLSLHKTLWDFIALMGRGQKTGDPMMARSTDLADQAGQSWTFGNAAPVQYPMTEMTTIRGGEYFFVPSMLFIDQLS